MRVRKIDFFSTNDFLKCLSFRIRYNDDVEIKQKNDDAWFYFFGLSSSSFFFLIYFVRTHTHSSHYIDKSDG
jgi:hypothetical protein